jgi:IS30 family transposase
VAPKREPLTMEDREDISRGLAKGLDNKDIASSIGRDESVVSREITWHGGREGYRAWKAHAAARESRSGPKERKIETDPELHERVTGDLIFRTSQCYLVPLSYAQCCLMLPSIA